LPADTRGGQVARLSFFLRLKRGFYSATGCDSLNSAIRLPEKPHTRLKSFFARSDVFGLYFHFVLYATKP
jgi:hypothetical protein